MEKWKPIIITVTAVLICWGCSHDVGVGDKGSVSIDPDAGYSDVESDGAMSDAETDNDMSLSDVLENDDCVIACETPETRCVDDNTLQTVTGDNMCVDGECVGAEITMTDCGAAGGCANGACRSSKRVFLTVGQYTGNFGGTGISAADAACQNEAAAFTLGGTWRAWLSTTTEDAIDRIGEGPWVRLDGVRVAANRARITLGGLDAAIEIKANGEDVSLELIPTWTGTVSAGTGHTDNCSNWTSSGASERGVVGIPARSDENWTNDNDFSCDTELRLYCFEI